MKDANPNHPVKPLTRFQRILLSIILNLLFLSFAFFVAGGCILLATLFFKTVLNIWL